MGVRHSFLSQESSVEAGNQKIPRWYYMADSPAAHRLPNYYCCVILKTGPILRKNLRNTDLSSGLRSKHMTSQREG